MYVCMHSIYISCVESMDKIFVFKRHEKQETVLLLCRTCSSNYISLSVSGQISSLFERNVFLSRNLSKKTPHVVYIVGPTVVLSFTQDSLRLSVGEYHYSCGQMVLIQVLFKVIGVFGDPPPSRMNSDGAQICHRWKHFEVRNTKRGFASTVSLAERSVTDIPDARKILETGDFPYARLIHRGVVNVSQL